MITKKFQKDARKAAEAAETSTEKLQKVAEKALEKIERMDLEKQIVEALRGDEVTIVVPIPPIEPPPSIPKGAKSAQERKRERKIGPVKLVLTLKVTTKGK